jgi:hypothetical protein
LTWTEPPVLPPTMLQMPAGVEVTDQVRVL